MKFLSTSALVLSLMLGTATVAVTASDPAAAAKPKAPSLKLSDPVRKAVGTAQEALKKGDTATAQASLTEAKGVAQTPDDRYITYSVMYELGQATKDTKVQAEAIDGMLQSGKVPAENQGMFYTALGQLAYNNQDYAKAEAALTQAVQLNPTNRDVFALAAEAKYKLKKPAEAVAMIQQAADAGAQAGTPIPQEWMARGIAIGADARLGAPVTKLTQTWLKAYPTQVHWRDALSIYRDLNKLDGDYQLDIMRLQRAAGALRGERDYVELAEATYLKFPNEAKTVLDEGIAAGVLKPGQSKGAMELSSIAKGKVAADKASLSKNAANGRAALGTADAYTSYGDYATAIELYRKALTLGGVDANLVNTRLGAALALAGRKDEAKQVFSTVTGPRADLAQYWMVFIDNPPAAG